MLKRLPLVLLSGSLVFAGVMPAAATKPMDNLSNTIQQVGEDLDNANAQVSAAMKVWRASAAQLPKAEAKLKAAKAALAKAQGEDLKAAGELQVATNKTQKAQSKLQLTRSSLNYQQTQVSQLVRSMYIQGPTSELSLVLGADTASDFTARVVTIARWHASKEDLISKLTKTREDLTLQTTQLKLLTAKKEEKKQVAEAKVLTAKQAAAEAKAAQEKVDKLVKEKAAALKIALKNRDAVNKRYKALKAEQDRLRKLAKGINDKGIVGGSNLRWPIPGAGITQYTGWRVHPVYGYRSCHTGIDLGASAGTPIRAAEAGVVARVAYAGPYGRYTLIAHGNGLTTFYAHQSAQLVHEGQKVTRGQIIGRVGSTGWSTGPHLHFEVRIGGTPYNPMGWFGGSKTKVGCVG